MFIARGIFLPVVRFVYLIRFALLNAVWSDPLAALRQPWEAPAFLRDFYEKNRSHERARVVHFRRACAEQRKPVWHHR
ncbi:MAG: hypothetical protein QOJ04_3435 [Caballeronia sp.]|nr:hypothetical protein [Caballeronia sp.]MEA3114130.1 hypothetical protein [Caballeronia sp.]